MRKNKKIFSITTIIIIIIIITILIFVDASNYIKQSTLENYEFQLKWMYINFDYWLTFISPFIAVIGTWIITSVINRQTINSEKEKFAQEVLQTKEINYRMMNKQNVDIILENVKVFQKRGTFIFNLMKLENLLDINICENTYKESFREDINFLAKLKEDFFYDVEKVEAVEDYLEYAKDSLENIEKCKLEINDNIDKWRNIYKEFFSYTREDINEFDYISDAELALKELWKQLRFLCRKDKYENIIVKMRLEYIKNYIGPYLLISGLDGYAEELFKNLESKMKNESTNISDFLLNQASYANYINLTRKLTDEEEEEKKQIYEKYYENLGLNESVIEGLIPLCYEIPKQLGDRKNTGKFVNTYIKLFEEIESDNYYEHHITKNKYI